MQLNWRKSHTHSKIFCNNCFVEAIDVENLRFEFNYQLHYIFILVWMNGWMNGYHLGDNNSQTFTFFLLFNFYWCTHNNIGFYYFFHTFRDLEHTKREIWYLSVPSPSFRTMHSFIASIWRKCHSKFQIIAEKAYTVCVMGDELNITRMT